MKYFWSDVHFSHRGILEFCAATRPFRTAEEMNSAIIERWNRRVGNTDDIYFLGDFSFDKSPEGHFYQLNGRKHLITGNHDRKRKHVMELPWTSIQDYGYVKENGARVVLMHYPIESWDGIHGGTLHFHGHQHGMGRKMPKRFDLSFDSFPDGPMSLEELVEMASKEEFVPVDHHRVRNEN